MDELNRIFGSAEQIWQYINHYAAEAGREATRVVLELYYVVMSPDTPVLDKTIIIAALAYQLLPEDLLNKERFGILSLIDNGAALALAYTKVKNLVTPQIEIQVEAILQQWFGPKSVMAEPAAIPSTPDTPSVPIPNTAKGFDEDEEVVID